MSELYGSETLLEILCISGAAGGGAAWRAGRAIAGTWRPLWHVVGYMAILGAAVRFVHFALFEAPLTSIAGYLSDTVFVLLVSCLAWQVTRARQMVTQYPWLYARTGPLSWRERPAAAGQGHADAVEM